MAVIPFHIVDAFATRPFTGNPAAIIPNAVNLSEAEMFQITDELSMEAGFVLPPLSAHADVRLRFFTRRREAALSGHVVIAAFVSLCDRGLYRPSPDGLSLRLETGAGVLPLVLTGGEGAPPEVSVTMPAARFGELIPVGEIAAALDLPVETIGFAEQMPQRVSCGFDQIIVPVSDRQAIRGIARDNAGILALTDRRGVSGLTIFCPETYSRDADYHCRFFHPHMGAIEDIASGTSLAATASYIVEHGLAMASTEVQLIMEQGHSLGRPTTVSLGLSVSDEYAGRICLAASGAVVMRGSFCFNRATLAAAY